MRIRVKKASTPAKWYASKIGREYTVLEDELWAEDGRYAVELPDTIGYILHEDCEIITEEAEELANITEATVLKDEALGVDREYLKVKRKARVGEKVRVFGHCTKEANGIFTVERLGRVSGHINYTVKGDPDYGTPYYDGTAYVVLEPSDIVRIGNVRYRMVERKAAVDESVIIVVDEKYYAKGSVHIVEFIDADGDVNFENNYYAKDSWYHVLEPVESLPRADLTPTFEAEAEEDAALIGLQREINALKTQVDGLTGTVAKMAVQLRVAREDIVLIEEGVTEDIERLERLIPADKPCITITGGADIVRLPNRDAIIERAKADVAELETTYRAYVDGDAVSFWPEACRNQGFGPVHFVEYVVDRNKRTVVALVKRLFEKTVDYRGIAKAAPGDCFNVHIGRAISLRRALGLTVPDEYVNAPQPTEVRVGDIVFYSDMFPRLLITELKTDLSANPQTVGLQFLRMVGGTYVIDDSRTDGDIE